MVLISRVACTQEGRLVTNMSLASWCSHLGKEGETRDGPLAMARMLQNMETREGSPWSLGSLTLVVSIWADRPGNSQHSARRKEWGDPRRVDGLGSDTRSCVCTGLHIRKLHNPLSSFSCLRPFATLGSHFPPV